MDQFKFNPLTRHLERVDNTIETPFTAGAQVGGHRIVTLDSQGNVIHADHTTPGHAGKICGLTLTSAGIGDRVVVCSYGLLENSSWLWDPKREESLTMMGVMR
ncbi:MAG: hypothetical protein HQL80_02535 [Magnetococcales bacterium]|nr:hypothetical protein [Magnetococcales bacterium]